MQLSLSLRETIMAAAASHQCRFPWWDICHWIDKHRLVPVLQSLLLLSGIFLFLHRRAERKWKKAFRDEKYQRLNRQEEALRHTILLRKAERERDWFKRKVSYVEADKRMLEHQIHDLQWQQQQLYEVLDLSRRDLDLDGDKLSQRCSELKSLMRRTTNTRLCLSDICLSFDMQEEPDAHDKKSCGSQKCAMRRLDGGNSRSLRRSVSGASHESGTRRSTLAAEPASPASAAMARTLCKQAVTID